MDQVQVKDKNYKLKKGTLSLSKLGISDISEIKGLDNLTDLRVLDLSNNYINRIKNLDTFANLFSLDLSNNEITEIHGLNNLVNLRFLKLSNNQIGEIKGLESLKNLMTLYLDGNLITEIKGLENNTRLNALYIARNNISEVKGIDHLRNLKRFDSGISAKISKDQIKELKVKGIHTKDQHYFSNRLLKRFIGYCIGITVASFLLSWVIVAGFEMDIGFFLPMSGLFFVLLFLFSPLLYVIGKAYAGY